VLHSVHKQLGSIIVSQIEAILCCMMLALQAAAAAPLGKTFDRNTVVPSMLVKQLLEPQAASSEGVPHPITVIAVVQSSSASGGSTWAQHTTPIVKVNVAT
jgi:hypothetical protein